MALVSGALLPHLCATSYQARAIRQSPPDIRPKALENSHFIGLDQVRTLKAETERYFNSTVLHRRHDIVKCSADKTNSDVPALTPLNGRSFKKPVELSFTHHRLLEGGDGDASLAAVPLDMDAENRSGSSDPLWERVREEALQDSREEPALASFLYSTILAHRSLERVLAFHLANKLSSTTLLATQLFELCSEAFFSDPYIGQAMRKDMEAVYTRDPACTSYSQAMLFFKGFQALQTHRVAHRLYNLGRRELAYALQSRSSEVFHTDFHPAAKIGQGVLFDHATGVVIGETAVIGDNVSILHHVTLGGTGKTAGDRHPKIGNGVLIGAGSTILGNVKVGDGAKIGAGSVVITDIPPYCTAVGVPARLIGGPENPVHTVGAPGLSMDQTSFLDDWSDYTI
eukprot:jgi/Mesvir1/17736/Mv05593-RA.1